MLILLAKIVRKCLRKLQVEPDNGRKLGFDTDFETQMPNSHNGTLVGIWVMLVIDTQLHVSYVEEDFNSGLVVGLKAGLAKADKFFADSDGGRMVHET